MTILKLIIAVFCSALSSAMFTFYQASSVFMMDSSYQQEKLGRLEAFIEASRSMPTPGIFWGRMFEGWAYGFGIAFIACFFFVVLSNLLTPNKSNQSDAQKERASA